MRVKWLTTLTIIMLTVSSAFTGELVPYRAWQFHKLDLSYVSGAMKLAGQYRVNTVVFSHGMIGETSQLFDGTDRGQKLLKLAKEAHDLGLKVWIWVHELDNVPDKFLQDGIVQMDRSGFREWLVERYEQVFTEYPEFDGLILTFHETQYPIFRDTKVSSKLSMPDRFAFLINTIYKVCAKYKKDFIVRTFLYEPVELQWIKGGLQRSDPGVMIQSKCEPHDWDPYYPHNPLIGAFPKNRQIVEFDCSSEFTGKNRIPYTSPEYFEHRWRYDLKQPGVAGYNARVDHGGYDALYSPNEINLYTLFRLTEEAGVTANDIWKEWVDKRYGRLAAADIENALRLTFHVVNKSFFPLHFWITNHSKLPSFEYADGHISERTIVKWIPENKMYQELEQRLNHPDIELLEMILAEKDTAITMAKEAMLHLVRAKPYLTSGQYDDFYWRLALLERTAIIWKWHAEAFFGYKILAEGHKLPGLVQRVQRALYGLYLQAGLSEKDPDIGDLPPGSAKEIRNVAEELQKKLDSLKSQADP